MLVIIPWSGLLSRRLSGWAGSCRSGRRKRSALLRSCYLVLALVLVSWALVPYVCEIPQRLEDPVVRSPRLLDRNGDLLEHYPRPDQFRHEPTTLDGIPRALIDATLVAEDKRFFRHNGMDYFAIARATRDLVRERRVISGASTITQQLVKISSAPRKRTVFTKIHEGLTARHLEYKWSKERILSAYLNRLDYGNHRQGCREAARFYFGKPLGDLSLAESALLAGLPQSPSRHDPVRNADSALKRRDWILDRLAEELDYDPGQIAAARNEPLVLHQSARSPDVPHLAAAIRAEQAGSSRETIRTTIDGPLQRSVNKIVRDELARLKKANARHAAVVVLDNASGDVLAMVGSGDFNDPRGGQINGALTRRSAGSTLKPFTYLLAFDRRKYSPGTVIADIPTPYRTEEGLDLPRNYDRKHHGPVTIRHALANSLNVSAMRMLNELGGPRPLHSLLEQAGLTTLDKPPAEYGLGLTIGNAEVTLLELTNAYAVLARLGRFKPANLHLSPGIPRNKGAQPAADGFPGTQPSLATPAASYLIAHVLSDNTARSAAFGHRSPLRLPFRTAVKTGTSSDFRDNWCIGFTRDFTVGVWVGNFDNTPMRGVSGVSGAGPIFHQTMLALHAGRQPRWVSRPAGLAEITIDTRTGHHFPDRSTTGRPFASRELCLERHVPHPVQQSDYDRAGRALLDPKFSAWFASPDNNRHDDLALARERSPDLAPRIISPMATATYLLDPELPSGGRFLKLLSNLPDRTKWSSPTLPIEGDTAHLVPGRHEITLTDLESGMTVSRQITVESL